MTLIAGCAHKGIVNIIEQFIKLKNTTPKAVIGGFHTSNPKENQYESEEFIDKLGEKLGSYKTKLYTCHCTGIEPYKMLKKNIEDINYIAAGDMFDIK
jgi:7,8-dihydropterin-6-yl-methyl-4-(beta-D-ribofuranosyl)aminobenzene 5'-phosphate synthase